MDPQGYDLLAANEQFVNNIGVLALIGNLNGPFSQRSVAPSGAFKMREFAADIAVGDQCYNGNSFGFVSAVSSDDDPEFVKITVKFPNPMPAPGVAPADHVAVRTEVYTTSLDSAVAGTTQNNSWKVLSNIGLVFWQATAPGAVTITMDSPSPLTITNGAGNIALDFNAAAAAKTIKTFVNDVLHATQTLNGTGGVTIVNDFAATNAVVFKIYNGTTLLASFGPYIVL